MIDQVIIIVVAIIGGITGSVSLGRQFWKERPRLEFTIESQYWYQTNAGQQDNMPPTYAISVNILMKNKGDRNTTIHNSSISFKYKDKIFSKMSSIYSGQEIIMPSGHSKPSNFTFYFKGDEIQLDSDITNVKFKIDFTHGHKEKIISLITKTA